MAIELNHTIVPASNPQASAQFIAGILGLPVDPPLAHFTPVTLANGVSLDFDRYDHVDEHHYAFQLGEEEFKAAFSRIRNQGITHYADPACREPGQTYTATAAAAPTSATPTVTSWRSSLPFRLSRCDVGVRPGPRGGRGRRAAAVDGPVHRVALSPRMTRPGRATGPARPRARPDRTSGTDSDSTKLLTQRILLWYSLGYECSADTAWPA